MNKLSLTALVIGSGLALAGSVMAGSDCHMGKGAGRMSQLDTNQDGKVSLAELIESKQSWLREVDGNKDGVVTAAEIQSRFQARRADHISKLFAEQDSNKDGSISREESRMPARWFARMDANSDGKLTREELTQRPGRADAARTDGRGRKGAEMDANGDGKIDAAEAKAAAERMLKRLDQNGDGVLDATELNRHGHPGGHGAPGATHGGPEGATHTQAS
jgi:Ca2+-binding EF-hand superfamily protein